MKKNIIITVLSIFCFSLALLVFIQNQENQKLLVENKILRADRNVEKIMSSSQDD